MKSLLQLFFCFMVCMVQAQVVQGIIVDVNTKAPLEGASVYFEGTTFGTISGKDGKFKLALEQQIASDLVISFLGYQDIVMQPVWDKSLRVELQESTESLEEVVITSEMPFTRNQMLRAFILQLFGDTVAGKKCFIYNEEAVQLKYDVLSNSLIAYANAPLKIVNGYLGYEVTYQLQHFEVNYFKQSLSPFDRRMTLYYGTSFFRDISEGKKRYQRRRKRVYVSSSLFLMRNIASRNWDSKAFLFFEGKQQVDPSKYFQIEELAQGKKVKLAKKLRIVDASGHQSEMIPQAPHFFVDVNGNATPPSAIVYAGVMGEQRLGDTLPLDYTFE